MTCKIVPGVTYNVFGGTLNLALSILSLKLLALYNIAETLLIAISLTMYLTSKKTKNLWISCQILLFP